MYALLWKQFSTDQYKKYKVDPIKTYTGMYKVEDHCYSNQSIYKLNN